MFAKKKKIHNHQTHICLIHNLICNTHLKEKYLMFNVAVNRCNMVLP